MERLLTPWRLRYVTSGQKESRTCVFCHAIKRREDRRNLVLHRGHDNFVILNKYPYNNGHLMIVPNSHLASPRKATPESLTEMALLAVRCTSALGQVYRPTGINLGMNLGRSAGAGIEGHYHLHLVPRWDGDTNFMTVVHGTRVIPEALHVTYRRLRPLFRLDEKPRARGRGARRPTRRTRGRR